MPVNAPNYQFPEDLPHVSGDRGTGALAVRNDTNAVTTDADGDYTYIATDATGAIKVVPGSTPMDIRNLDCLTDSVSVCQLELFDVAVTGTVEIRSLDCSIDSITICPPVTGSFDVEIVNEVNTRPLDCLTDSISVCQLEPFDVAVTGVIETRPLDCEIDSITICPPVTGIFDVDVLNEVNVRPLDCEIDSITVCPPATGVFDVNVVNSQVITVIPGRRSLRGVYFAALGPITYTTAADAATGGDVWLVNTSASVVAYLKHLRFTVVLQDLALLPQLPTIRLERMTFTGTPSGTLITPAKRDSADLANTATVRTTSAGMVITAGAAIDSYSPAASDVVGGLLAANAAAAVPSEQVLDLTLDDYIVLRQNEGLVIRQHTAGAATENRFYWVNFNWEEI